MDADRRRTGQLRIAPDEGVLVVGGRTATLEPSTPPVVVVGAYVDLVVAQRSVRPTSRHDLRDRELAELAAVLALPPAELDALIEAELDRLLGRTPADLPGVAAAPSRRRRPRSVPVAVAGAAIVAAAVAAGVALASGGSAASQPASSDPAGGATVEVVVLPDGSTATRTESAPAPAGDGVDIGTAVQYEREG